MKNGSTLRSSGVEIVAPAGCQGPPFFLRPTPTRCGKDSAAYTSSAATTLSCTICQRRGGSSFDAACGSCRTCGRANGRAPTRSLDAGKRPPAPTATTGPSAWRSTTATTKNALAPVAPVSDTPHRPLGVAGFQAFPPGRVSTFGDTQDEPRLPDRQTR